MAVLCGVSRKVSRCPTKTLIHGEMQTKTTVSCRLTTASLGRALHKHQGTWRRQREQECSERFKLGPQLPYKQPTWVRFLAPHMDP